MSDEKLGKLKWFDPKKGYGFIVPNDGSADVMVLHGAFLNAGFVQILPNQPLRYTAEPNERKPGKFRATAVQPA